MLIFLPCNLAYLANPKTGTTAVEQALRPDAEIAFAKSRKHMTARNFRMHVKPFVDQTYKTQLEAVAVMRDPLEHLRSWYRYRCGPQVAGTPASAERISFDTFARATLADKPPNYAKVGSQYRFATNARGNLIVDHLFAYETQIGFRRFLSERLQRDVILPPKNVSPHADTTVSDEVIALLRNARAKEFALYDRLMAARGYLHTPLDQAGNS